MIPAGSEPQRNFFHDKLDETTHIKSRVSVDPKVRTQTVAARTEAIDAPIGSCWAAVGDAAASFDPLSSFGLTNALESGRLAGLAIDATLAGERGFIEAYGRHVRRRTEDSDILRSAYHGMEARWPRSPFWDRRRGGRVDDKRSILTKPATRLPELGHSKMGPARPTVHFSKQSHELILSGKCAEG